MPVHAIPGIPSTDKVDKEALLRWEKAMRRRVDAGKLPGFVSCVISKGAVVHVAEYGFADLEQQKPFTIDSILRIYCMTKTMVAMGILILWERGQLQLTDPVSKYIPGFAKLQVVKHGNTTGEVAQHSPNVSKKFTILRLLTHTAGVGYGAAFGFKPSGGQEQMYAPLLTAVDNNKIPTLEEFCNELAKLPLRYQPAKGLQYGMGHDVLGRIIEVVSGQALDVFFHKELFKPLHMNDTGFFVPKRKASRLAALYGDQERAKQMAKFYGNQSKPLPRKYAFCRIDGDAPSESNWIEGRHCKIFSGNGVLGNNMGGLVSTLSDQARFFTMILNGGVLGRYRILQTSTVDKWCFQDLLPLPGARGKRKRTGTPWSGWSALGERGLKRTKRDPKPLSDEYEEGEVAMGGAANTMWSVNPVRDQMTLFFAQTLDGDTWRSDHSTSSGMKASSENFVVAARATAGRDAVAAAVRRQSLSSRGQPRGR